MKSLLQQLKRGYSVMSEKCFKKKVCNTAIR